MPKKHHNVFHKLPHSLNFLFIVVAFVIVVVGIKFVFNQNSSLIGKSYTVATCSLETLNKMNNPSYDCNDPEHFGGFLNIICNQDKKLAQKLHDQYCNQDNGDDSTEPEKEQESCKTGEFTRCCEPGNYCQGEYRKDLDNTCNHGDICCEGECLPDWGATNNEELTKLKIASNLYEKLTGLGLTCAQIVKIIEETYLAEFPYVIEILRFNGVIPSEEDCNTECGDNECTGSEDEFSCPNDCPPSESPTDICGDKFCTGSENFISCPGDCPPEDSPKGYCGDGICNDFESIASCPSDCIPTQNQ